MENPKEGHSCSQWCSWCVRSCLHLGSKRKSDKYAGVQYELLPHPQADFQRNYVMPQAAAHHTHAIVLPKEMQSALRHGMGRRESQFTVTQQPTSTAALSPREQAIRNEDPRDSSSSLSESTPPPISTPLRSQLSQGGREETIDISQSPTGTFSSAYRHAQRKKSQGSHSLTKDSSIDSDSTTSGIIISSAEKNPNLDLSLYYNVHSENLSIYLHCARHLPPKTGKNYSLILHLTPQRSDTLEMKITGDNPSPSLSQSFEIANLPRDDVRSQQLIIHVHDGTTSGDLMCGTTIALEGTDLFGMMFTVQLDPTTERPRGELLLSLCYNHDERTLQGILLKLTNSIKNDRTPLPDIYIKVYLMYKGKRIKHWKSSSKQFCLTPIFNEAFQFSLNHMDIHQISLDVCMMCYDRFAKDEEVGRVLIGDTVHHETGVQHWKQIISQPQSRISHWHTFLPATPK